MGKNGKEFYGIAALDDHIKLKIYEMIYGVGIVSFFIGLLIAIVMAGAYYGEGESIAYILTVIITIIGVFCSNALFIIGVVFLIGYLTRVSMRKKWDNDPPAITKLTSTQLETRTKILGGKYIVNRIPISIIKNSNGDVEEYLSKKGVKLPIRYRPFKQIAPGHKMSHTFLYHVPSKSPVPFDNLILLELSEKFPIIFEKSGRYVQDPNAKGFFSKLIYKDEKGIYPSRFVVLSIRPTEQDEFHELLRKKMRNLEGHTKPKVLDAPPG